MAVLRTSFTFRKYILVGDFFRCFTASISFVDFATGNYGFYDDSVFQCQRAHEYRRAPKTTFGMLCVLRRSLLAYCQSSQTRGAFRWLVNPRRSIVSNAAGVWVAADAVICAPFGWGCRSPCRQRCRKQFCWRKKGDNVSVGVFSVIRKLQ